MGNKDGCAEAVQILVDGGFHRIDIEAKVREFAKYLLKLEDEEINEDILNQIRNRGYRVSRFYWINLSLSSFPENTNIVISDLRMEDIIGAITPYFISTDSSKVCPKNLEIIERKSYLPFRAVLEKKFLNTEK